MAKEKKVAKSQGKLILEVLTPEKVVLRDSEIDIIVVKAPEPAFPDVRPIKMPESKVPMQFTEGREVFRDGRDVLKTKKVMGIKELPETMREDVPRVMDDKPGVMRDDAPRLMEDGKPRVMRDDAPRVMDKMEGGKPRVMRDDAPRVMDKSAPPMADLPDMPEAPPTNLPPKADLPDMPGAPPMGDLPDMPDAPPMGDLPERPNLPPLAQRGDLPALPKLAELEKLPDLPTRPIALKEVGIMNGHAPMLVNLPISPIRYKKGEELHWLIVAGGFLEVRNNKVTILSFGAEIVTEEPDEDLAIAAKKRVESWLLEGQVGKVAFDEKAAEADIKKSAIELYKASSSE